MKKQTTLFKISFIILSILLITSCKDKSSKKENLNRLKLIKNYDKEIKESDVLDTLSYRFIPLETTDESVFGRTDKVLIDSNRIFVLDTHTARQAFIFDIKGKFISKLGTKGQGPNDFLNLQDMTIDRKNKNIILFDLGNWRLLYYTYDGDFIKSVKFKTYPGMSVSYIGNGLIATYSHDLKSNQGNQLLIFNEKGEVVSKKYLLRNKKLTYVMPCQYFSENDNGVFCIPIFEDKICKINDDGSVNEVFDFGIADLMINDKDKEIYKETAELLKLKKYHYFRELKVANNGMFIVNNDFNKEVVYIIGNINNGEMISGIINGPIPFGTWRDYFITTFHPYHLRAKEEFKNAKLTDNQGIILFKLKEDFYKTSEIY